MFIIECYHFYGPVYFIVVIICLNIGIIYIPIKRSFSLNYPENQLFVGTTNQYLFIFWEKRKTKKNVQPKLNKTICLFVCFFFAGCQYIPHWQALPSLAGPKFLLIAWRSLINDFFFGFVFFLKKKLQLNVNRTEITYSFHNISPWTKYFSKRMV